jgi:hypothetical protein
MRLRLACVLFAICVTSSAATAQRIDPRPPANPIHKFAYDAGLYTPLDLAQSASGSIVALGYAYADPWMIQVGLGPSTQVAGRINSAQLRVWHPVGIWIDVGDGYVYPDAHWFEWHYITGDYGQVYAIDGRLPLYDAFAMWPETLELELTVTVAQPGPTPTREPHPPTLAPEVTPEPTPPPSRLEQDFVFRFSVRVHPPHTLQPDVTITRAGLEVTLTRLAVTPVRTLMEFCFRELDGAPITDAWNVRISEATFDRDALHYSQWMQSPGAELIAGVNEISTCKLYEVHRFYDGGPGRELNVTIDRILTPLVFSRREWSILQTHLRKRGVKITLDFNEEGDLRMLDHPQRLDLRSVAAELDLTRLIEGPWTVVIPIPASE